MFTLAPRVGIEPTIFFRDTGFKDQTALPNIPSGKIGYHLREPVGPQGIEP